MKRVFRIQGKGKMKDMGLRGLATHPEIEDVNTTVTLIQTLIPLGLRAVGEALAAEVTRLVGPRYSRTSGIPGHVRWCHQQGSIYLADQKLPHHLPAGAGSTPEDGGPADHSSGSTRLDRKSAFVKC